MLHWGSRRVAPGRRRTTGTAEPPTRRCRARALTAFVDRVPSLAVRTCLHRDWLRRLEVVRITKDRQQLRSIAAGRVSVSEPAHLAGRQPDQGFLGLGELSAIENTAHLVDTFTACVVNESLPRRRSRGQVLSPCLLEAGDRVARLTHGMCTGSVARGRPAELIDVDQTPAKTEHDPDPGTEDHFSFAGAGREAGEQGLVAHV